MSMLRPAAIALLLSASACTGASDEDVGRAAQPLCGLCDTEHTNAEGVVNIEGGNSCVMTEEHGLVCPLAFTSVGGAVSVTVTVEDDSQSWSLPVSATYGGAPVTLTAVAAMNTWPLVGIVDAGGRPSSISGASLANLILSFRLGPDQIQLQLNAAGETPHLVSGVYENNVRARVNGGAWSYLCTDHLGAVEPASLYGGAFFDPVTGQRTNAPATVMLSCKKGGITTCMEWGYRPWQTGVNELTGQTQSLSNAHVACIQMKRAAYCGDGSWTRNGTPIAIDDVYNINPVAPATLEAVWSPNGAVCLNMDHRRHMDISFSGSCNGIPLLPCPGTEPWWWAIGGTVASGVL